MTRIYRDTGIDVTWTDHASTAIGPDGRHSLTASSPRLTLIILSRETTEQLTVTGTALGATAGTRELGGRAAHIFYERVERAARTYKIENVRVLAHAMAHEIGHLLLPYGHSATGLMVEEWNGQDLRRAVHGQLKFTAEEAALIRTRLLTLASESANTIQ